MKIKYNLNLTNPNSHQFEVRMSFLVSKNVRMKLTLPTWIPGSYMIRNFARNITSIKICKASGEELFLNKIDKQSWDFVCDGGEVIVTYQIYANDISVRSAFFDTTRAYFNGACLFLRLVGQENTTHELTLERPKIAKDNNWLVATEMPSDDTGSNGFGVYKCDDYFEFIDYPFEITNFQETSFYIDNKKHRMVFVDADGLNISMIGSDVARICAEHYALFNNLPFHSYLFMTLATPDGYGGLEHRNSSSLICKRSDLPFQEKNEKSDGYINFLSLCSHEYFHLWNVKRIQPEAVKLSDLSSEAYTELLWIFEGITSYYDDLTLPRAGIIEKNDYLNLLAPLLTRHFRAEGRKTQSLADSSFYTWIKLYIQDENSWNETISYYNKGAIIAFGLDSEIRMKTNDEYCLDDLMRLLWEKYGKTDKAISENGIREDIESLVNCSFKTFFDKFIFGTEQLPLEEWLGRFGVGIRLRPARDDKDLGGYAQTAPAIQPIENSFDALIDEEKGYLVIRKVKKDGNIQESGLSTGDILVAIDGEHCLKNNLLFLLNKKKAGNSVEIVFLRRGLLKKTKLLLKEKNRDTCDLFWLQESQLSEDLLKRRRVWLRSSRENNFERS
tara:strand:+ start:159 stop:2000 length:1842 start_codon:yes stop_codon:yes gene_type:complete